MHLSELVPELWTEILQYCSKHELTRTSLVNSSVLEISRDIMYHTVLIRSESFFETLTSLRDPLLYQRLRYLIVDMSNFRTILTSQTTANAGKWAIEVLLESLGSSNLRRLDILGETYLPGAALIATKFAQMPSPSYIKIVLPRMKSGELARILQTSALKELHITLSRLMSELGEDGDCESLMRPSLTTLLISQGVILWSKLLRYVYIGTLKRLAVWDQEDLVVLSAPTLKDLSLWITLNLLEKSIPEFIRASQGFPALSRLSLFIDDRAVKRVSPIWASHFTAYHRSILPLLSLPSSYSALHLQFTKRLCERNFAGRRHLLYICGRDEKAPDIHTLRIASDFASSCPNPTKELVSSISQMFDPIQIYHEFGVRHYDAWPFFDEDEVSIPYT
ncbi:hypothetical protein DL96DRAFT_1623318 [Flagelloscypha sp. PMI_526]|nr:hypothetical protein DL96DRAFT_1623318 [Flagelloscypha sp. PMI_526]